MGTLKVFFSRNTGNFKNAWNNYLKCIMDTVFGILYKYCTAKKKKKNGIYKCYKKGIFEQCYKQYGILLKYFINIYCIFNILDTCDKYVQ